MTFTPAQQTNLAMMQAILNAVQETRPQSRFQVQLGNEGHQGAKMTSRGGPPDSLLLFRPRKVDRGMLSGTLRV